jgi:hypothetical protein
MTSRPAEPEQPAEPRRSGEPRSVEGETPARPAEPSAEQVQQFWWLHDARWYQEVGRRFGFDVANEINKEVLAFVAYRVARSVARSFETPVAEMSWDDVLKAIKLIPQQMWPPEFVAYIYEDTAPGELTTKLIRNFAITMSRRAGTLDTYACPCVELRSAWHRGLGLDVAEDRIETCMKDGADACTYRASYRGFGSGDDAPATA